MRELDHLSPDQRAVLSLVLMQDKSYAEVASLLGISEQAVRDRAHAALDALAVQATHGARGATWIDDGDSTNGAGTTNGIGLATGASAPAMGPALASPAIPSGPRGVRSSRLGGALLLAVIVAAVVVAAILISGGGGKGSSSTASSASTHTSGTSGSASGGSSSTTTSSSPRTDKVLALTPVDRTLKAAGVAYVLSESGKRAFYIVAQGLPAPASGSFYAVWLYNSPTSAAPLGRAPAPGSGGRTEGGGPLPSNAGAYHKIVMTRETNTHATHPGEIVLSGSFALH